MSPNIDDLLSQLTLEEKISLLSGANSWQTASIDRLGIPAIKVSDGPNGARGEGNLTNGLSAACFPVSISLASSWNVDLVERVGQALGQEARTKNAHLLLAPTVNIHRSPLNGRNFECFSEDPYLSARIAVAYINGVQSQGIGTTVKHFVGNDSEFERNSISSEIGERALREIYLQPFQAAIQEAHSWAVMSSYNKLNGTYTSENPYTLTQILRQEWGFEGLVMSDWFGTKSTAASVNAGLDLEMPGPTLHRGEKLFAAVQAGEVSEATIDAHVRIILLLIKKTGAFEQPQTGPELAVDLPEHRALIREAAAEGAVLLKNTNQMLPLQRETLHSLAIIGPNAKQAQIMAGGSSQITAHYQISPFDGLVNKLGKTVKLEYAPGCHNFKQLPLPELDLLMSTSDDKQSGLTLAYFNSPDFSGEAVATEHSTNPDLMWFNGFPGGVNHQQFSLRISATLTPQESGIHAISLVSSGLSRLLIDGQVVIDNWEKQVPGPSYFGLGSSEVIADIKLEANCSYAMVIEFLKTPETMITGVRFGYLPPVPTDLIEQAAKRAAEADVAIVFAGLNGEWESEGFDRTDINLPDNQVKLIEQVAAANPRTIVVLNTGSPISMPWLDKVDAVLQSWYPGQECGNAIADLLFGDINPSGKLPQTFPVRVEDNPAFINYPGENGKVHYGEGLFVGYRYYEKKKVAPLFPFGFGLSYTQFTYDSIHLSATEIQPDENLTVTIEVTNSGQRAGKEIVQLYVRDPASHLHRPEKELKAFAKIQLATGETKRVDLILKRDALAYYDDLKKMWVAEAGEFVLEVGASSQDIRLSSNFTLKETAYWSDQ